MTNLQSMGESTSRKPKKLDKGKGKAKETKSPKKTLAQLKKEGMRNANARKRYMKRLKKDWIPVRQFSVSLSPPALLKARLGSKSWLLSISYSLRESSYSRFITKDGTLTPILLVCQN